MFWQKSELAVLYPAGPFRSHGHRFRTAIRSSFSVVPKKCKNIFWEFFLNKRERGGSSPCITLGFVCSGSHSYTQAHSKPGDWQRAPRWVCAHTHRLLLPLLTLPCSSHGNVSCRLPQGASLDFCLGLMFLPWFQARWQHRPSQTPPALKALYSTLFLHTRFLLAISHSLHRAVKTHTANFIHKLFWWVNKSQRARHNKKGQNTKNPAWHQLP